MPLWQSEHSLEYFFRLNREAWQGSETFDSSIELLAIEFDNDLSKSSKFTKVSCLSIFPAYDVTRRALAPRLHTEDAKETNKNAGLKKIVNPRTKFCFGSSLC